MIQSIICFSCSLSGLYLGFIMFGALMDDEEWNTSQKFLFIGLAFSVVLSFISAGLIWTL